MVDIYARRKKRIKSPTGRRGCTLGKPSGNIVRRRLRSNSLRGSRVVCPGVKSRRVGEQPDILIITIILSFLHIIIPHCSLIDIVLIIAIPCTQSFIFSSFNFNVFGCFTKFLLSHGTMWILAKVLEDWPRDRFIA